ncbi:YagK/YfjJ domain-containing protein [Pseudomonas asiatica]|uniref:YagK/YfjJ domain-containing protein n=1 Tax=Pseudomonas asiatica TaxID=2219225 RepID=UPI0025AB3AF1|nr:inovirus-type Gp2 protein [Pseudomonas asiatica]MDM9586911.1 inovirus-type Gp2 protein [Pseudomonas asiatica]
MKKKEFLSVEAALLESTITYFDTYNANVMAVGGERNAVLKIKDIEMLVKEISASDEIHFYEKISHGVARADLTKTGKRLLMNVWAWEEIERYYPIHDFTPGVKVFFECTKEYARDFYYRRNLRLFDGSPSAVIESLNNVVERIRSIVRGCEFKSEQNARRRLSNKNYKSLLDYIEAIFEKRSRVLVLRVDLGYSKPLVQRSFRQDLSFDEVKRHREKLLRLLRRKLPAKTFLGHAWKLEFGLSKSYHYHCIFFLDGSKLREDVAWARTIGELWAERATGGKGVYYNCNRAKGNYRACGIGMIEHTDRGMRKNLQKAALYLTKIEYYIRIATEGQARTFGRGGMPKRDSKKMGRPRQSPSSVCGISTV